MLTGVIAVALYFGNGWGIIGKADNWAMFRASLLYLMGVLKESNHVCYACFTTYFSDTMR